MLQLFVTVASGNPGGRHDYYLGPPDHQPTTGWLVVLPLSLSLSLILTVLGDKRSKKNGGQGRKDNRVRKIAWVFTDYLVEQDAAETDAIEQEAIWLSGDLALMDCKCYAFQTEICPKTSRLHFQGYFELTNKKSFDTVQKLTRHFHFLQERKGTQLEAWRYASKLETRLQGPWIHNEPELLEGKKKDTTYSEVLAAPTLAEALVIIKANKARDYCLYGDRITKNVVEHLKPPPPAFKPRFPLESFCRGPLIFSKTTLVYGNSNTGKTSFVKAHFNNPLFCSHIDNLKRFDVTKHDAIIFDDMAFDHWPIASVIHLVDMDEERTIHIRYGTVTIPAGVQKVFTSNKKEIFYKPENDTEQIRAIERRVEYFHVTGPLYGPMKLGTPPPPVPKPIVFPTVLDLVDDLPDDVLLAGYDNMSRDAQVPTDPVVSIQTDIAPAQFEPFEAVTANQGGMFFPSDAEEESWDCVLEGDSEDTSRFPHADDDDDVTHVSESDMSTDDSIEFTEDSI